MIPAIQAAHNNQMRNITSISVHHVVLPSFVKILLMQKKDRPSYIRPSSLLNSITFFSPVEQHVVHKHFFLMNFVQINKLYFSDISVLLVRIPGYLFIIYPLLLNKLNYKLNKPKQIFSEQAHFMRRLEFYPRQTTSEFLCTVCHWDRFISKYLGFFLPVAFHQRPILIL